MFASTVLRVLAPFISLLHATSGAIVAPSPRNSIDVRTRNNAGSDNAGCLALAKDFNDKNGNTLIFYQGTDVYNYENSPSEFWSNTEILSPSCVFRPTTAQQIGEAVTILKKANIKFALRGGGHMGVTVRIFPLTLQGHRYPG